jgi:hypothetical protein
MNIFRIISLGSLLLISGNAIAGTQLGTQLGNQLGNKLGDVLGGPLGTSLSMGVGSVLGLSAIGLIIGIQLSKRKKKD